MPRTPGRPLDDGDTADAVPASFPLIWSAIAAIPPGHVGSYGEVAARSGLPRRARLVAQALRAAPEGLSLPWFRVIRSNGKIAFAVDSAAFQRQKRLLEREGVHVHDNGRVVPPVSETTDDLDALLWRPSTHA